ncbi:hypothetical protein D3C84_1015360 [compost metagenome]
MRCFIIRAHVCLPIAIEISDDTAPAQPLRPWTKIIIQRLETVLAFVLEHAPNASLRGVGYEIAPPVTIRIANEQLVVISKGNPFSHFKLFKQAVSLMI